MPKRKTRKIQAKSRSYVLRKVPGSKLVKAGIELYVPAKIGFRGETKGFVKKNFIKKRFSAQELNKVKHFMLKFSKKDLEAMDLLKSLGIGTYKIIEDLKDGHYLIERTGLPLITKMSEFGREERLKALQDYVELIKKLHVHGIRHGHPHFANVMMDEKGKLILIDFKELKRTSPKKLWASSAREIADFFYDEYPIIYSTLRMQAFMPEALAVKTVFSIIDAYKIPEEKKKKIKDRLRLNFKIMEGLGI